MVPLLDDDFYKTYLTVLSGAVIADLTNCQRYGPVTIIDGVLPNGRIFHIELTDGRAEGSSTNATGGQRRTFSASTQNIGDDWNTGFNTDRLIRLILSRV